MMFQKASTKESISVASSLALLVKNFFFVVSKNCLWSEKSQEVILITLKLKVFK